jgi:hypothetical protein
MDRISPDHYRNVAGAVERFGSAGRELDMSDALLPAWSSDIFIFKNICSPQNSRYVRRRHFRLLFCARRAQNFALSL